VFSHVTHLYLTPVCVCPHACVCYYDVPSMCSSFSSSPSPSPFPPPRVCFFPPTNAHLLACCTVPQTAECAGGDSLHGAHLRGTTTCHPSALHHTHRSRPLYQQERTASALQQRGRNHRLSSDLAREFGTRISCTTGSSSLHCTASILFFFLIFVFRIYIIFFGSWEMYSGICLPGDDPVSTNLHGIREQLLSRHEDPAVGLRACGCVMCHDVARSG
jgi:hypothetical protein